MAKHRKTLKQKKIADVRHKFYSFDRVSSNTTGASDSVLRRSSNEAQLGFDSKNVPYVKPNVLSESKNAAATASLTNKYPYLLRDISKTGILTGLILIAQITLFFLLKNHILVLPMVKY